MKALSSWCLGGKWGSWGLAELSDLLGQLFLSRAMYLGCRTDVLMSVAVFRGGWWIGKESKPPTLPICKPNPFPWDHSQEFCQLKKWHNCLLLYYFTFWTRCFLFYFFPLGRGVLVFLMLLFFVLCKQNFFFFCRLEDFSSISGENST